MNRFAALILTFSLAAPALAAPDPQLARSVAQRLDIYGIRVDPARLTTAQASALYLLMVSERGYLRTRSRARAILRNPDFRD